MMGLAAAEAKALHRAFQMSGLRASDFGRRRLQDGGELASGIVGVIQLTRERYIDSGMQLVTPRQTKPPHEEAHCSHL